MLITRASLPPAARRRAGSVLAFAVEEETLGEPDANHVSWLGAAGDADVLAVVDRQGLARWRDALDAAGIHAYEVHCETLLLPWRPGEWSLAWDGREGFVRTGELEGAATDSGDRDTPPLTCASCSTPPTRRCAAVLAGAPRNGAGRRARRGGLATSLGVACRMAGPWDWRAAPPDAGVALVRERQSWRALRRGGAPEAGGVDRGAARWPFMRRTGRGLDVLAAEQRVLRQQMEARFRAAVPDAVAVADPALQMRRKLAEARHAAGLADNGDFLPLIEQVAAGMKDLPAGSVRVASYESGRLTLELAVSDDTVLRRVTARLREAGLNVDTAAAAGRPGGGVVITVRSL